jgi:hypothetical protein
LLQGGNHFSSNLQPRLAWMSDAMCRQIVNRDGQFGWLQEAQPPMWLNILMRLRGSGITIDDRHASESTPK